MRWLALLLLPLMAAPAAGEELTVQGIVKTIRFHPEGEPARVGLSVLSRMAAPGWNALSGLVLQYAETQPELARAAARAFAEGPESERLALVATTYLRTKDAEIRAILAVGLAYGYEAHEALLSKHMRENRRGAREVLEILAPVLDERELRDYLRIPDLAPTAYAALRRRRFTVKPHELVTWARSIGRACLDRQACADWAGKRDFVLFEAVALALEHEESDDDVREGAHCLLLTLSGKPLPADTLIWRSWIASHRDRYEPPGDFSEGRAAAAVVRAARYLRHDLMHDGRCIWAAQPRRGSAVGATALAVLALRAAGYPKDHPAIEKALRTLLVFDKAGEPALAHNPDPSRETYNLSCLAMALCELDPKRFRVPLEALAKRITSGMHPHGQWGYRCLSQTDAAKRGRPDTSCTQYAVLALRALSKAGFRVPPETWKRIATFHYVARNRHGGWNYTPGGAGPQISMTSAGISSLAIAWEGLYGRGAAARIASDAALIRARRYLGRMLMLSNYSGVEPYAFYGVERACVLTGTREFESKNRVFDWYERGARRLLEIQAPDGHWGYDERREIVGCSYGPGVDTSYGILFLTRATATIAGSAKAPLTVDLPADKDEPEPPPPPPKPDPPPPPPRPPELELEWERVPTRTGGALIRGVVRTPKASLTADGKPVALDARGRFVLPVTVAAPRDFRFVATARNGLATERKARVVFDLAPPEVTLLGPLERHVGKQVLVFRASEPLRALRVGGRVFPADGTVVRAAVEVTEGRRQLAVTATDRAGNESLNRAEVEAVNRFLLLDGQSAVGVDLRERPGRFTVECWARGEPPARPAALVADTEGSGFGLFWWSRGHGRPYALVRAAPGWIAVDPKRGWDWSKWTHLALTYDGARLRYFVNGRLQGETAGAGYHRSGHRLFVGAQPERHGNPVEFHKGAIDEVRISRVVRYEKDFRPARNFMRDRHTLVLLHFDRETLAAGVVLDDSGTHHHGTVRGAPVLEKPATPDAAPVLDHAAGEMARLMPPLRPLELTPAEHAEQNVRARLAARVLHLLQVRVRVRTDQGIPLGGIAVRALHETFDLAAGPAVTDERGEALLRLPRGPWRFDLVSHEPKAGRIVFARVRRPVRGPGREEIVLARKRSVRFRTRLGQSRAAHAVTLAWPDLTFHKRVEALQGQFEIRTADDEPMLVQAVRRPSEEGGDGYVLRRAVGPGTTIVDTEPEDGTAHTFDGKGVREMFVRYGSADALPVPLAFASKDKRTVLLAGLREAVVGLDVDWNGRRWGFYPRPFALDGKPRTFSGMPPFEPSVGYVRNWRPQYKTRVNSVSLRVFLRTKNGLLLEYDPKGAYTVFWEQLLDGKARASGSVKPPTAIYTPPLDPKLVGNLRYRLRIRGPNENRTVEVAAHEQDAVAQAGKVSTRCFSEVFPNTRLWVACVERAVRAYELTCPFRSARVDVERSIHMPLPIIGMGGFGGANGWMWLPERSNYGFASTWYWNGLLCHELGHVYHYGHGNPTQTRIMVQAGRRAGRKLWSIRPGMERVPEGDRYRPLLEAVTRGEVSVEQKIEDARDVDVLRRFGIGHAAGDGVLVPNLELTGDDAVFGWYYRSMYGEKVDAARRANAATWSWWLTRKGFSDPEIQIAMFSRAAGTSLAWLARMRGTMVHDHRIEAALKELKDNEKSLVQHREREAILHRWRTKRFAGTEDLDGQAEQLLAEVGHRWERVLGLRMLAREHFSRNEPAAGEAMLLRALVEARLGGEGTLERAGKACSVYWAAR